MQLTLSFYRYDAEFEKAYLTKMRQKVGVYVLHCYESLWL